MLILKALSLGPMHGLGVSRRLEQLTEGVFQVQAGSLFPALHRMERHGWIEAEWGVSDTGRRAKYYSLTEDGRGRLKTARGAWERMTRAIGMVLGGRAAEV